MPSSRSFTLLLSFTTLATTLAGPVQSPQLVLPPTAPGHREAVKDIFNRSYGAYRKFAFGHDDLNPVSGGFNDGRNGWGATIVDGMPTMFIMGLDDFFNEAVKFVNGIDFSKSQTPDTVSVFETTIRYVGGLLSAYELSGQQHPILVQKAQQVADKMAFAWASPGQKIPFGHIDFSTNQPERGTSNIAEAGTLDLEWSTLSKYTRNDTYRRLTEDAVRTIAAIPAPLPGLAAQGIDPRNNKFVGSYVTWGGGSDSYFEYLIKYARLTNTDDNLFADTWATAVDSSIKNLLRTSTVGNHVYLADQDDDRNIIGVGSHLACFHGGNWIYGGKLLNNEEIVKIGLQLVDACWNTYASTQTGIGPEVFRYITTNRTDASNKATLTPEQQIFYEKHGFYITGADYILRPEVLESNFYAWRATGDYKYLDRAASAIDSFNKFLPANKTGGFAGLNDVDDPSQGQIDDTESFWFAEVLKYLYLTFDDPNHISLDEWVFNTEAQPFKAPKGKPVYGSGNHIVYGEPFSPTSTSDGPLPEISPNKLLPTPISGLVGNSGLDLI
ncbi:glycoside hydrolase family 47 protein [Marasmius fiardii PR-910]|nr:glycoside hydrolase family 47 protein [Marasmius fiardii PR-910]